MVNLRSVGFSWMDRAGLRFALGLLASAYLSATREPCLVSHGDGGWIHRWRSGVVVSPRVGGLPPARQAEVAVDIFLWGHQPSEGDVIIDVGAGIGTELLAFSSLVGPSGRVIAVEAHPVTFSFLKANVHANSYPNVELVNAAATDERGSVIISDDREKHVGNSIVGGQHNAGLPVAGITLDDLTRERGIESISLLKMNIEGAEVAALRGAEKTLSQTKAVVVSCHDFKADRTGDEGFRTRRQVIQMLRDAGLTVAGRRPDPRVYVADTVYARR